MTPTPIVSPHRDHYSRAVCVPLLGARWTLQAAGLVFTFSCLTYE